MTILEFLFNISTLLRYRFFWSNICVFFFSSFSLTWQQKQLICPHKYLTMTRKWVYLLSRPTLYSGCLCGFRITTERPDRLLLVLNLEYELTVMLIQVKNQWRTASPSTVHSVSTLPDVKQMQVPALPRQAGGTWHCCSGRPRRPWWWQGGTPQDGPVGAFLSARSDLSASEGLLSACTGCVSVICIKSYI